MPKLKIKFNNKLMTKDVDQQTYRYSIQVGSYRNYDHALQLQLHFISKGFPAEIIRQGECFTVLIGNFNCMDEAVLLEHFLKREGYNTLLVAV